MRRLIAISAAVGFLGSASLTAVFACTGQTAEAASPAAVQAAEATHSISVSALDLQVGKAGAATLRITPKKGWKVNKDYPTKVKLSAPSKVAFDKMVLKKSDAKVTDGKLSMLIGAKGKVAGDEVVKADVRFSICNDKACLMEKATLSIKVTVR